MSTVRRRGTTAVREVGDGPGTGLRTRRRGTAGAGRDRGAAG
jgi:hypothetical protein